MDDNFTEEEIKKALEQADANISFEEVDVLNCVRERAKTKRIDKNDKQCGRSN